MTRTILERYPMNSGLDELTVSGLAMDPSNPAVLYACGPNGVYKTFTGGEAPSASAAVGALWQLDYQGIGLSFLNVVFSQPRTKPHRFGAHHRVKPGIEIRTASEDLDRNHGFAREAATL